LKWEQANNGITAKKIAKEKLINREKFMAGNPDCSTPVKKRCGLSLWFARIKFFVCSNISPAYHPGHRPGRTEWYEAGEFVQRIQRN